MMENQIIEICTFFSDEMNNGGFLQLLYNDSNACLKHIPECLTAIGADEAAAVCQTALSVFPAPLPDDLEQRRAFLTESITPEIVRHLENCDTRFNGLADQLEETLGHFMDQHFPDDSLTIDRAKPKDYVALYCKLNERTASSHDDLSDPKLRRRHNKAMTEIHNLNMELFAREDKGSPIILKLLQSGNPRIRLTAGAYCLQAQIHEAQGKCVLEQIAKDSTLDRMIRFDAECCIEYCRPYKTL